MVFDIRPRMYWNKGEAVRWIASRIGQPNALVIFIGGDPTDEDAFAALPDGITIGVAPHLRDGSEILPGWSGRSSTVSGMAADQVVEDMSR